MKTSVAMVIAVALTVGCTTYSVVLYPHMPNTMPDHWGIHGKIDGYGPKAFDLFLMPGVLVFLLVLWNVLPWLSPRNFKVEGFREAWDWVWLMAAGLMAFCHLVIIEGGRHPGMDFGKLLVSGLCVFLALLGLPLAKVKRNFWMGYRTPWTLASEEVWESTHLFASKTLMVTGLAAAAGVWVGVPVAVCAVVLLVGALLPVVQSVVVYKGMERRGALGGEGGS